MGSHTQNLLLSPASPPWQAEKLLAVICLIKIFHPVPDGGTGTGADHICRRFKFSELYLDFFFFPYSYSPTRNDLQDD